MKRSSGILTLVIMALAVGGCETTKAFERTTWQLAALDGASVTGVSKGREAHLFFDEGPPQRASGSTGCNRLTASYSLRGSGLKFGPIATTKMACLEGMDLEHAFLAVLQAVDGWRIVDGRLVLLDMRGAPLAEFTAAPRN
jgi:heat shock protein HslJ